MRSGAEGAAFGATPDRVPRGASRAEERWLVAVALGGQGRYAAAATELARLAADPGVPPRLAAHAAVTRAAHLRQLGGHAAARTHDAVGLRLAAAALRARPGTPHTGGVSPCRDSAGGVSPPCDGVGDAAAAPDDGVDLAAARIDALVGLAADAIGLGARPRPSGCSPSRLPRWRRTRPGGPRPGRVECGPSWPSCVDGR